MHKYLEKLFSMQGRISRLQFWQLYLAFLITYFLLFYIIVLLLVYFGVGEIDETLEIIFILIMVIIGWWIPMTLGVKRLHDRDRSGWYMLIGLIPLGIIWLFIEIGLFRGTIGSNTYGKDPNT